MSEQAARRERNLRAVEGPPHRTAPSVVGGGERRTIVIRGQVEDRYGVRPRPRRSSSAYSRLRPERAALWAVLLGLALVIAALASAHI